MLDLTN